MMTTSEYSSQAKESPLLEGAYHLTATNKKSQKSVVLNGVEIAHEYKVGRLTLLITRYDHYEGVDYWFNLLSENSKILDVVMTPEYFGFMQDVEIIPTNAMTFGFYDTDDKWHLQCLDEGRWSFRFSDFVKRPFKQFFNRRWLHLKKEGV